MTTLLARLADHRARPPDTRTTLALLEALAAEGAPPGGEALARALVFDHLDLVQDHLPPESAARLEALLEPTAGPLSAARPSPALDARVLAAVRREAPRPMSPPPQQGWLSLAQLATATAMACCVAMFTVMPRAGAPVHDTRPLTPGAVEIRLDRTTPYRTGDGIFVQMATTRAGHLALLVVNAAGKSGVNLTDQEVTAGQVVVSHLTAGPTEGPVALIAVLSNTPLVALNAALRKLPPGAETSIIIKLIEETARRQHATAVTAVALGTIKNGSPR